MPKSSSKKKKQKNLDFCKPKLKLGAKQKRKPDNYTDTSFRSQAIVLPNQSAITAVLDRDASEPVNRKNQTITDLLVQSRHYSAGTRRDAVAGIKEFFQRHPQLLVPSLGALSTSVVKLLMDEDESVRRALLSLLSYILPQAPSHALSPFLPLFVTCTVSAMAHIQEGIRMSAIKFLALWIEVAPKSVVAHADRILPNYLCLLGAESGDGSGNNWTPGQAGFGDTGSGKGKLMSYKTRIEILSGIYEFLNAWTAHHAAAGGQHQSNLSIFGPEPRTNNCGKSSVIGLSDHCGSRQWYFRPFISSPSGLPPLVSIPAQQEEGLPITEVTHENQPVPESPHTRMLLDSSYANLPLFSSAAIDFTSTAKAPSRSASQISVGANRPDPRRLLSNLYPVLLSTWLDAAPSAFIEQSEAGIDALQSCAVVVKLLGLIWKSWMVMHLADGMGRRNNVGVSDDRKWLDTHVNGILKHFMSYFPFGNHRRHTKSGKLEAIVREMNANFCELVALFLLALGQVAGVDDPESAPPLPKWAERVVNHLLDILGWERSGKSKDDEMVQVLHPDQLVASLPAIWCLMNALKSDRRADIFEALLQYYYTCSSHSASKRVLLDFIFEAFMVQYHRQYIGPLRRPVSRAAPPLDDIYRDFALSIPRTVFELRNNHPATSLAFLRTLLRMCVAFSGAESGGGEFLDALQAGMVPYFHAESGLPHASRKSMLGPFVNADRAVQKAAVDVVVATVRNREREAEDKCELSERMKDAFRVCLRVPSLSEETGRYITDMLSLHGITI